MSGSGVIGLGFKTCIVEGMATFSGKPPLEDILILPAEVDLLHLLKRCFDGPFLLLGRPRRRLLVLSRDDKGVLEVVVVLGETSGLLADEELLVFVISCMGWEVRERL